LRAYATVVVSHAVYMAKKRRRIETLIDAQVWLRRGGEKEGDKMQAGESKAAVIWRRERLTQ